MNTVKLLVCDIDGTLTDGKLYIGENGELFKAFNVKDGYGLVYILPTMNITPVIITLRVSKIVENRAKELKIKDVYQGITDKTTKLQEILRQYGYTFENVAYIGDDLNDLDCMRQCALKGCPADAAAEIKAIADFVCTRNGGAGAVREFIEWIRSRISC